MNWFVYIVLGSDGSLYTGITKDVTRRLKVHNSKKGAKALLGRLPVKLVYKEKFLEHEGAAKRESEIKSWTRDKKLDLVGL